MVPRTSWAEVERLRGDEVRQTCIEQAFGENASSATCPHVKCYSDALAMVFVVLPSSSLSVVIWVLVVVVQEW